MITFAEVSEPMIQASIELLPEAEVPLAHRRLCQHCGTVLSLKRLRTGSRFCTPECYAADKLARRSFQALFNCRLCHRSVKAKKAKLDPVRDAHNPVEAI